MCYLLRIQQYYLPVCYLLRMQQYPVKHYLKYKLCHFCLLSPKLLQLKTKRLFLASKSNQWDKYVCFSSQSPHRNADNYTKKLSLGERHGPVVFTLSLGSRGRRFEIIGYHNSFVESRIRLEE